MSEFIASNGVELDEFGDCTMGYETYGRVHEARKEFYQHLWDKELGQTREGNIIVRPLSDDEVLVLDEIRGESERWHRHQIPEYPSVFGNKEAKRYFAAHPEPKPWHDAKPGEIWVIHETGFPDSEGVPYVVGADGFRLVGFGHLTPLTPLTSPEIVEAVRIWPKEEEK